MVIVHETRSQDFYKRLADIPIQLDVEIGYFVYFDGFLFGLHKKPRNTVSTVFTMIASLERFYYRLANIPIQLDVEIEYFV